MIGQARLKGRKIAVLVENMFIPGEIDAYRQGFSDRGAEVQLMSNLWGQEKLTFVSTVDWLIRARAPSMKPRPAARGISISTVICTTTASCRSGARSCQKVGIVTRSW